MEIERRGIYSKTNFKGKYPHFDTITSEFTQASDHAFVWVDFALCPPPLCPDREPEVLGLQSSWAEKFGIILS